MNLITGDLQNETIKLRPRRVFKCKKEDYVLTRAKVWKDKDGKYYCNSCNEPVEDITDTTTGQTIMEIIPL